MLKYIQIQDGVFLRHIFDIEPTRWDENNYCYARRLTLEQTEFFGVVKLKIVTPPYFNPATQRRDEGPAVLIDGVWTQQYFVTDLPAEEVKEKYDAQSKIVRAERNRLLETTDWTQLADSTANKTEWATYRQALRDVTTQGEFPWNVNWPVKP